MWLEDFTPQEFWEAWPKSAEVAEKIKEAAKKSASWIKRVAKDEKKAKKYDNILAWFLVEIIRDKKYDFLLRKLFMLIDDSFPSHFLLWILSLVYDPISDNIRSLQKKEKIVFNYKKTDSIIEFDDSNLDQNIKNRINSWIEDSIWILWVDYSSMQIKNLLNLLSKKDKKNNLSEFISIIFTFFLKEQNILIPQNISLSYSDFIVEQIFEEIKNIKIEKI